VWDLLPYISCLPAKTKGGGKHPTGAHNKHNKVSDGFQLGWATILVLNQLVHRATTPGDDQLGLGHWCWDHLRGKDNQHLWVVAMYQPVSQMDTSQLINNISGDSCSNANQVVHTTSSSNTSKAKWKSGAAKVTKSWYLQTLMKMCGFLQFWPHFTTWDL